jgi:molybdopterin-guanine dinucleotide biosynthesis protein A
MRKMYDQNDIAVGFLAGGLARRMGGRAKAMLQVGGRTVLDWQLSATSQHSVRLLNVNGDAVQYQAVGLPIVPDNIEGYPGPLAGILACLNYLADHHADVLYLLSCATDAPFIPADLAQRLAAGMDKQKAILAQARSNGQRHPVFGLWPVSLRGHLRTALTEDGLRKIDDFTAFYATAIIDFHDKPDPFLNVNRPEDLERAEAMLADKHDG